MSASGKSEPRWASPERRPLAAIIAPGKRLDLRRVHQRFLQYPGRMKETLSRTNASLDVRRPGLVGYQAASELQAKLVSLRRAGEIPDTLLLLEHPHVITLGSSSRDEHVLLSAEERAARMIELYPSGRGGDVTYHGPGQLVGYPILDLKPDRCDLHAYLRDLEEVLIRVLRDLGIEAGRAPGLTGVWIADRKIAAIGVRVSSGWVTSHGFALNVDPDLSFFDAIVPCGLHDHRVTSIAAELGRHIPMVAVQDLVVQHFCHLFSRTPIA
jgi:lipoyl(octanoyl) transferase